MTSLCGIKDVYEINIRIPRLSHNSSVMKELIKSYEPAQSEDQLYLWLGVIVGVAAFTAMGMVIRKKFSYEEQTKKWLIALLLFFLGLIAGGTALFSWLAYQRAGVVNIYADHLELGKRSIPFDRIKKIHIEKEKETSFVNPNIVQEEYELMFIEDTEGGLYVISEKSYPVREIMKELKQLMGD